MEEKRDVVIEKYYKLLINKEAKKNVITKIVKELQEEYQKGLKNQEQYINQAMEPKVKAFLKERLQYYIKENNDEDYIKYIIFHKRQLKNAKLLVERQLKNYESLRQRSGKDQELEYNKKKQIKLNKTHEYLKFLFPDYVSSRLYHIINTVLMTRSKEDCEFYINSWLSDFHIYLKDEEISEILKLIVEENPELN